MSHQILGLCPLNFSLAEGMIKTTAIDCWTSLAPFLANVICCPQLHATLVILLGQSGIYSRSLAIDLKQANHCISDLQKILASQGASIDLQEICSVQASNLTAGGCPVDDIDAIENLVDSDKLILACKRVDSVNECCSQICQNAILESAKKLAISGGNLNRIDGALDLPEHLNIINGCKNIIMRWLTSRMDQTSGKQLLRRISNCNVNSGK